VWNMLWSSGIYKYLVIQGASGKRPMTQLDILVRN